MKSLGKILTVFLFFSMFLMLGIAKTSYCDEPVESRLENQEEIKFYVSPEQIEMTDQGIVVWSLDWKTFILSKSLSFDGIGLYIKQPRLERGPCGLHDRWCKTCGGCGVLLCPMNCTCFD